MFPFRFQLRGNLIEGDLIGQWQQCLILASDYKLYITSNTSEGGVSTV